LRQVGLASRARRQAALRRESETLGRLAVTPEARSLIRLFFTQEALKKDAGVPGGAAAEREGRERRPVRSVLVLGAGMMGGAITWLASNAGLPARMKDIVWDAVAQGYHTAHRLYQELARRDGISAHQAQLRELLISGTTDYDRLGKPDAVIEAVVEQLSVKRQVLAELEQRIDADALVFTNTSSFSLAQLSSALKRPQRFAGLHFFNPVNRMRLVEVVAGRETEAVTVAAAVALARRLGKSPVVVRDCPGFLVNRLLMPHLAEAVLLLEEGADFPWVDRALRRYGMPMGPFRLLDEVGLDVGAEVAANLHRAYGERLPEPSFLERLAGQERLLGRKGGKGFYLYAGGDGPRPNPQIAGLLAPGAAGRATYGGAGRRGGSAGEASGTPGPSGGTRRSGGSGRRQAAPAALEEIQLRCLLPMLNEAAYCLDEGIVKRADYLDLALVMGIGFPPFRGGLLRWADGEGLEKLAARMEELAGRFGPRFRPHPLLAEMAAAGRRFYAE
jgi:3-hydroxyacyl-CoA dehydrogenase/enoyl-CoA hydratase/3-hydroxybutyryl-CoA epimerase